MSNIISLNRDPSAIAPGKAYNRELREEYGLTIVQVAAIFNVSPSTIEVWEARIPGRTPGGQEKPLCIPDRDKTRIKFERFIRDRGADADKNLLFGVYPLRVARDILGMSVETIAQLYNLKPSTWQKIEANVRALEREKLRDLESRVRQHFVRACAD